MFPRDEQEAEVVLKIIDTLRFHQAPELVSNSGGYFLYPPSEFDIGFYYNGQVNPNIPRISTCVLESIETNYAPGGFAAYEVPLVTTPKRGQTGMHQYWKSAYSWHCCRNNGIFTRNGRIIWQNTLIIFPKNTIL